jgi:multidrug efflux pump subunit AcrA (membrane-fusion protein)
MNGFIKNSGGLIMKKIGIICLVLGMAFTILVGCSGCSGKDTERQQTEAERQAELDRQAEAARQAELARQAEAERQAELARQAEAERQAELARQAEAERQAELARQAEAARQAELARQAEAARRARVAPADPENPIVGTWSNSGETVVMVFNPDGSIRVNTYVITDEYVEVYWRTNRNITGGGFYDTRNPVATQSNYIGSGSYTINRDTLSITLSLTNDSGSTKEVTLTAKLQFDGPKSSFRLGNGLARKYIYREDTRAQIDAKEYVSVFYRQS